MPKAPVIPWPVTTLDFPVDRIPELRAALRELNAATNDLIRLLNAMQRPQRARNLAIVPKPRCRK